MVDYLLRASGTFRFLPNMIFKVVQHLQFNPLEEQKSFEKLVSWRLQLFCEQDLLWKRTWSQHLTAEREENYWNVDGRKKLHSVGKTDKKREEKWIQREDPPVVFVEKAGGSSRRICEKSGRILPSYLWKKREDPPVVFVEKAGGSSRRICGKSGRNPPVFRREE